MATRIILPKMSSNMESGTILEIHAQTGQVIAKDTLIFTIETDKTIAEIFAPEDGLLALEPSLSLGAELPVDSLLGYILTNEEPVPSFKENAKTDVAKNVENMSSSIPVSKPLATPLARKMAKNHEINLATLQGSGPQGRIRKSDIESYLENRKPLAGIKQEDVIVKPNRIRSLSNKRISESWQEAPHVFLEIDIDMSNCLRFKEQADYKLRLERERKLSLTAIVIQEVGKTLAHHPRLASSFSEQGIVFLPPSDICCAIATDEGLVTPVIRNVNTKTLLQIDEELASLIAAARSGRVPVESLEGGSFTISNLGMYGVLSFTSVLNRGQSGILALGGIIKKPVVQCEKIVVRPIMRVTLSIDHRSLDGVHGAEFLKEFKERLES